MTAAVASIVFAFGLRYLIAARRASGAGNAPDAHLYGRVAGILCLAALIAIGIGSVAK